MKDYFRGHGGDARNRAERRQGTVKPYVKQWWQR